MASCNIQKRCFLCLNFDCAILDNTLINLKIVKYLEIKVCSTELLSLCAVCIEAIESFHIFYEKVKSIHQGNEEWNERVSELVKVELLEDDPLKWENSACSNPEPSKEDSEMKETKLIDRSPEENFVSISDDSDTPINIIKLRASSVRRTRIKSENSKEKKVLVKRVKNAVNKNCVKKTPTIVKERLSELIKYYENVTCPLCPDKMICDSLDLLNEHFRENHPGQKGFIVCCEKKFVLEAKNRLRVHLKTHFNPESCRCDICGKTLATPRIMRLHKERHIPEEERQFSCEICGKKFGGNRDLTSHRYAVHSEHYSVCQICGKEMKRVCLRRHMKHVHEGLKKTYVCAVCGKTYRSYSNFHHHMKSVHTNNYKPTAKTKLCPDCGKWVRELSKHKRRQHSGNRGYECTMCERVFKLPWDLRHHMISHTDERPFPCSVCGAAFKTKGYLKIHMGQHTGTSQVKCPYCGKMISNPNNYLAHRRRMHLKEHMANLKLKDPTMDQAEQVHNMQNVLNPFPPTMTHS